MNVVHDVPWSPWITVNFFHKNVDRLMASFNKLSASVKFRLHLNQFCPGHSTITTLLLKPKFHYADFPRGGFGELLIWAKGDVTGSWFVADVTGKSV